MENIQISSLKKLQTIADDYNQKLPELADILIKENNLQKGCLVKIKGFKHTYYFTGVKAMSAQSSNPFLLELFAIISPTKNQRIICLEEQVYPLVGIESAEKENIDEQFLLSKTDTKRKSNNYVYIMFDSNTGYFKLGRSKNPAYRERTLQSEKPTISIVYFSKAEIDIEKQLHEKYKQKRIRGEWFSLTVKDVEEIKSIIKINSYGTLI